MELLLVTLDTEQIYPTQALSAVRAFLPSLAAADKRLSKMSEQEKKQLQVEAVDEAEDASYVEMNVALMEQTWSSDSGTFNNCFWLSRAFYMKILSLNFEETF